MQDALKIGAWTFHPQLNQLTGADGDAHLEPRSSALLFDLVQHSGRVRSREELLDAVWGDAFVGEAVLTHCIWELRKAFQDSASNPRYIQTIPRRGYRLLASVEPLGDALLRTLLLIEGLVGDSSTAPQPPWAAAVEELLEPHRVQALPENGRWLVICERPVEALRLALDVIASTAPSTHRADPPNPCRAVIHLAEVPGGFVSEAAAQNGRQRDPSQDPPYAVALASGLLALAQPQQILLTRGAFDLARAAADELEDISPKLRWQAHGAYSIDHASADAANAAQPIDLFEVGAEGLAPLRPPAEGPRARRLPADGIIRGWRAAQGLDIPSRPHWHLRRKMGEGGFGEVWLGAHESTGQLRVFKFCYEAERLRALQREASLFRLLKETLGERQDIVRILDWNFDQAPYFLEIEHTDSGSLPEWAEAQGGLEQAPLGDRLEIVAQIAEALAAAHSVGVLHKDVKPSNILIQSLADGAVQARLTDFGISRITDKSLFAKVGITALGISGALSDQDDPSNSGTRLYQAPEVLEGKPFTTRADLYALGVVLYQVVVGDLERAMAVGWERSVDDPLLIETLAACVDGSPERRLASVRELADELRSLESRRQRRLSEERSRHRAEADRRALEVALRRRRSLTRIALATALALLVVTALAWRANHERRAAELARREAEWRHQQAEGLVSFMLGDLRDKLEPLGRLDILEEVGDRAMDYFEQVPEEHWSDGERNRRSLALRQIGEVRMAQGDLSAALTAFRAALNLVPPTPRSLAVDGLRTAVQDRQVEALNRIGQVKRLEGDLAAAEAAFGESLELAESLAAAAPEDSPRHLALCASLFWVGQIRFDRGDLPGAMGPMQAYLEIAESWAAKVPQDDTWQLELAQATSNVGSVMEKGGDLSSALAAYRRRLEILEGLVAKDPSHTAWQLDLALAHNTVGVALAALGQLAEADHHFAADLAIKEALVATDPANSSWKQRLATSHYYLGKTAWQRGRLPTARQHFRRQLEIAQDLVTLDPRNSHWRRELGIAQTCLGQVMSWQGLPQPALAWLDQSVDLFAALAEQEPEHRDWHLRLAKSRVALGHTLLALRRAEAARGEVEKALEALAQVDPAAPMQQAEALLLEGSIYQAVERFEEAKSCWQRGLDLIVPLARANGRLEHLALWVRAQRLLGNEHQAMSEIADLDAAGYREPHIPTPSAP